MNFPSTTFSLSLPSLVQQLPELTVGELDALVGSQTEFTEEEANKILTEASSMKEPEEALQAGEPNYKPFVATAVCKALKARRTCHNALPEGNKTGFCQDCWYPNIVEDYEQYRDLRAEGYSRDQAAVLANIFTAPAVEVKVPRTERRY